MEEGLKMPTSSSSFRGMWTRRGFLSDHERGMKIYWKDKRSRNLYHYGPCCYRNGEKLISLSDLPDESLVLCLHCQDYLPVQIEKYRKNGRVLDAIVGHSAFRIVERYSDGLWHFAGCCAWRGVHNMISIGVISDGVRKNAVCHFCLAHLRSGLSDNGFVNISNDGDPYSFGAKFTFVGEDDLVHFEENLSCPWNGVQGKPWEWNKWASGKYDNRDVCPHCIENSKYPSQTGWLTRFRETFSFLQAKESGEAQLTTPVPDAQF